MSKLRLRAGATTLEIELDATPTAAALLKKVPFESVAQTWGEEVYFEAPVSASLEAGARQTVDPGTVCYWVEGSSLALPYGRTPISGKDGKPKLVTACNVLGRIIGDPKALGKVKSGERIRVEAA
ncbi:MAG TPA: cyclophilin-like fold protein [Burkholderiales bacterium]|jgi:hypothetical protein|nr:cyclophilin-like fold protein [Burkholderiales bacterium]